MRPSFPIINSDNNPVSKNRILNRDEMFNSAVLICLFPLDGRWEIIFEKRAQNIRQAGQICLPGGGFDRDLDRNLEETALRESREELSITKGMIKNLDFFGTIIAAMGAAVDVFFCELEIEDLSRLKINPEEVEKMFSLPVDYFIRTKPHLHNIRLYAEGLEDNDRESMKQLWGNAERNKLPGNHKILHWPTPAGPLWGLTASIIREFTDRLK